MAKLSGVKTLDMVNGEITKVEYDGAVYGKVGVKGGKAGDLGLRIKDNCSYAKIGEFYPITAHANGRLEFADDVGSLPYVAEELEKFVYFRKMEQSDAFKLVTDREPKAGDFVKYAVAPESYITAGKYYEITEIDGCGDPQITDDDGDDYDTCDEEFEVYEKVGAEAPKEEATKQPLKVGDYAKVVGDNYYSSRIPSHGLAEGTVVKINVVDESGHEQKYEGKPLDNSKIHYFVESDLVKATDEEQAEAKAELEFAQFSEGNKVRLLSGGGEFPLNGFYDGEIYEVKTPKFTHETGSKVQLTRGSGIGYAKPHQLEKVSAEETHKATFKVGDYARVTVENYEHEVGHIIRINDRKPSEGSKFDFGVDRISRGGRGFIAAENIEKISEEEVAGITAKQAEQARWASINRKPNEFKKGDIVKVTLGYDELKVGDIGVISDADGTDLPGVTVRGVQRYVGVELITPVEQRFDFAEVSA